MYLPEPEEEQQQCTDTANIPGDQKLLQISSFFIRFKEKFVWEAQCTLNQHQNMIDFYFGFVWNDTKQCLYLEGNFLRNSNNQM